MRSVSEKEAELSSLRQTAQTQQSSLQQERERNSRELGELQGKLQEKVSKKAELSSVNSSVHSFVSSIVLGLSPEQSKYIYMIFEYRAL